MEAFIETARKPPHWADVHALARCLQRPGDADDLGIPKDSFWDASVAAFMPVLGKVHHGFPKAGVPTDFMTRFVHLFVDQILGSGRKLYLDMPTGVQKHETAPARVR